MVGPPADHLAQGSGVQYRSREGLSAAGPEWPGSPNPPHWGDTRESMAIMEGHPGAG